MKNNRDSTNEPVHSRIRAQYFGMVADLNTVHLISIVPMSEKIGGSMISMRLSSDNMPEERWSQKIESQPSHRWKASREACVKTMIIAYSKHEIQRQDELSVSSSSVEERGSCESYEQRNSYNLSIRKNSISHHHLMLEELGKISPTTISLGSLRGDLIGSVRRVRSYSIGFSIRSIRIVIRTIRLASILPSHDPVWDPIGYSI